MKKKFIPVFFLFAIVFGIQAQAQKLKQVKVDYDVEILEAPEMDEMSKAMMADMTISLAFKDKSARVEMHMAMMDVTVIANDETKKGVMLMEMMGQKMANPMDESDLESNKEPLENYEVKETGRTKKIAGHVCKEAIITAAEGGEYTVWYTEDIQVDAQNSGYTYSKINGFPLEMDIDQDEMKIRMKATEVSSKGLSDDMFNTEIPAGYQQMDPAMMGGGR